MAKAERLAPQDIGVLLSRAQAQLSLDRLDLARDTLRRAERFPGGRPEAVSRLYAILGRAYLERKQPELTLAALLRAKQAAALDVDSLLLLATLENNLGAYADAAHDALLLVEAALPATDAQRAAAASIGGLAFKNQNRPEDAIRWLERATHLVRTPTAWLALAEIYERGGKLQEAIQVLERARADLPDSSAIAIALGRNLVNVGNARLAIDVLTHVGSRAAGEPEAWRWLAEARMSAGEGAPAISALRELAKRAPDYPMIDVMIVQALLKHNPIDYDAALRALDRAEKTSPADPDIFYLRGKIYAEQERFEEAVAPLRRAIELAPAAAQSYYQLGLVYRKLGRASDAALAFERFTFLKGSSQ